MNLNDDLTRRGIELSNGGAGGRYLRWRADPLTITGLRARIGAERRRVADS